MSSRSSRATARPDVVRSRRCSTLTAGSWVRRSCATIGIMAALRHRDLTGEGQQVDIAMFDAAVAMTDVVMNFASLGQSSQPFPKHFILDTFRAADGWFVMQLVRDHQLPRLAEVV